MTQVGRISGPLLQENLLRNGSNLTFRNDLNTTQLLLLDVTTGKIGVNTSTTSFDLDVLGTTQTTNLITPNTITPVFTISDSTFNAIGNINLNAGEAIVMANMENGTIRISDNIISTINSNANIDITPNGTGTTEIINDLNIYGNLDATGSITFGGNITVGDNQGNDKVIFQTDIDTDIIPDQTNAFGLGTPEKRWGALYTYLINGELATLDALTVQGININFRSGGIFWVDTNGDDDNVGDNPMGAMRTIAAALARVDPSTNQPFTIMVKAGTYEEVFPLVVPENVTILGNDIRNTVVKPTVATVDNDAFHLNDKSVISNLTIKDFKYDSANNTGYAFRFAPNAVMNERSPYLQNVTVLTSETNPGDQDSGRGAWIDGDELNSASTNATMLFHSCTFISPGADVINMTNGVRVEWLNSFTYFANRGLYAFNGTEGRTSIDGSTTIYGAELRSIGSANVYGTYGAIADGADCLMYLIQHNFAYIGAGSDSTNDLDLVVQANEVVELNSGRIQYVTTDQVGNFRIGDNFFVNFETGNTSLNIDTADIDTLSGLTINSPGGTTMIDGAFVDVSDLLLTGNTISSKIGDLNLKGSTGTLNLNDNTNITGNLDIVDNFSFGGTLNIAGDQPGRDTANDRLVLNVEFEQNFNPHLDGVYNLGEVERYWENAYVDLFEAKTINVTRSKARLENIEIDGNIIQNVVSNADLELRASGTGRVVVPYETVQINNNVSANDISGTTINTTLQTQFNEANVNDITITQNFITTTTSNSDLELRASGTGNIRLESNAYIVNDLSVAGTTKFEDDETNYEYGPELIINGTFDNNVNGWSQSGGGNANDVNGNLQINSTGAARNVSQEITVVAGKTYDFEAQFRSVSNGNPFYLRIFESGIGTLQEWNETSGLTTDQILTFSFTAQTSAIDVIFRSVDNIVEWDNVSMVEDIGLVTTFTPVQVNINGNNTQTGNTTQTGDLTQTGNIDVLGNLTVSNEVNTTNFNINNNLIKNVREGLRLNTTNSSVTHSLSQMIYAMADGDTVDDYPGQTEKNLITFLANGTSAPDYALSYADVNRDSITTTSDALAWLQYIANGTTGDTEKDKFIKNIINLLIEDEFTNEGKYNSIIFLGDYLQPNFNLKAAGTGRVIAPNNDVRVTQDLFASSITTNDITVTRDLDLNEIIITDSIIEIDDNTISTTISNSDLDLRAEQDIVVPANDVIITNDLTVNDNTDIDDTNITGTITQVGNRNQIGNLSVTGTVTVSTSNIKSEIQFDDIIFNDNFIETTNSNADLELRANGTGKIILPGNDVRLRTNMTIGTLDSSNIDISNSLSSESLELSSNTKLFDNVITTTQSNSNLELKSLGADVRIEQLFFNSDNITTIGSDISLFAPDNVLINSTNALKLPIGLFEESNKLSNNIRFNSTFNTYEAFSNQKRVTFNGIYSDNIRTNVLAHPTNNTINFTVDNVQTATIDADGLTTNGLLVDDISVQSATIRTVVSNSDLQLRTDGTGVLRLNDIDLRQNEFINTTNAGLVINNTGYGKVKFADIGAVRIPAGTTAEQPIFTPEIGMMRWNTQEEILETWDGGTFVTAAGTAATISAEEMDDLILEYTLIFG